jgi:ubiquitin C-terminal hydrolase
MWLLDLLQGEFNYSRARGPLLPLTASQMAVRREQSVIRSSWMQWKRFCHSNNSIITHTFFGQNTNSITCPNCGSIEKSWEPWAHMNVPILGASRGEVSLEQLLDAMFKQPHALEDYRCDHCKQEGPTSLPKISRCPDILILVLGRHEWHNNKSHRKNTRVKFPLENLSLDQYFIPLDGKGSEPLDEGFIGPFIYDCYVVVRHEGPSARQGHYIALVKETDPRNGKDVWVQYNDHSVSEVEDIRTASQTKESYILLYQRRKNKT